MAETFEATSELVRVVTLAANAPSVARVLTSVVDGLRLAAAPPEPEARLESGASACDAALAARTLDLLDHTPGATVKQIASALQVSRDTAERIVNRLASRLTFVGDRVFA